MKQRKRTEKSKYKHESTGEYCTCAAYVAEVMCRKNAENKNVGSLPYKFWSKKPWDWTFKRQLFAANKILKDKNISEQGLVRAVNSKEFDRIFSLNHPSAIGIIKKYQLIVDQEQNKVQEIEYKKDATHRKKKLGKKNIFDRIRGIEDGQEES